MIVYIVLGAIYLLVLAPLAVAMMWGLSRLASNERSTETYQGIAASSLVAVCEGLWLTKGIAVQPGILAWLTFVIVCGVLIWLPSPPRPKDALACAIAPSLCLLGTLLAVYFIPLWLEGVAGAVISTTSPRETPVVPERAITFTLFVALATIPAIAIAIAARNIVISVGKTLYGIDPNRLGRVEKTINTLVRITTSLAAVFVVLR